MKYLDIKGLSPAELSKKKKSITAELFELKMKNELGQLANPLVIRHLRKDLARVNTALSESRK
jgi:large subunit ribosomal protein L29